MFEESLLSEKADLEADVIFPKELESVLESNYLVNDIFKEEILNLKSLVEDLNCG